MVEKPFSHLACNTLNLFGYGCNRGLKPELKGLSFRDKLKLIQVPIRHYSPRIDISVKS